MFSSPVGVKGNSMQQSSKLAKMSPAFKVMSQISLILINCTPRLSEQKGRIDILFVNAGLWEFVRLQEITEAHFDKLFNVNVKGLLFTVQKSASTFSGRWFYHPNGFNRRIQRSRRFECLSFNQGCYTIVRTFLDRRSETAEDPGQFHQSWSNRHTWFKTCFADCARSRETDDDLLEHYTSGKIWQSRRYRKCRLFPCIE